MTTLSAVLIVRNESKRIETCLRALRFADEIIVLDTGSTDDTCEKVSAMTNHRNEYVKLFHQEGSWQGYGAARVEAQSKATCEWIVQVDADEYITEALAEEIQSVVRENIPLRVYSLPRKLRFFFGDLRFGGTYPDYAPRLYQPKDGTTFTAEHKVHESLQYGKNVKPFFMKNHMIHDSFLSVSHFYEKQVYYARLWSAQRRDPLQKNLNKKQKFHLWDPFSHAFGNFVIRYVFRFGFLDGRAGFLFASVNASFTYMKYSMAYIEQKINASTSELQRADEKLSDSEAKNKPKSDQASQ